MHEAGPAQGDPDAETTAVVLRDAETKRTTYEICLPKAALELDELTGGVQFGLGMAINDGDEATPGQKGWGGLGAHSIVHGKSPEETALVTLATANDIESGKEYYFASPITAPIVLDGELNDWTGIGILSDPRFWNPKNEPRENQELVNFKLLGGDWTGPDDQTSAVQVAFDQDNVYFAFVVTDEYHENAANSAWNGDSVQLMIANEKQDTQIALYNYALGGVEDGLGDIIVMHEAGPAQADPDAATEAIVIRNTETKRTTYEIRLPKAALALNELTLGTQFGLGMAINDGDELTPGQKGWGGLGAHSIVHGKSPEQTALVTLGTGGGGGCFLSAISTPTIANLDNVSFRANDFEGCIVDPATTTLLIDGQPAELVASAKNLGATDFTHTLAEPFATGSEHTFTVELRDTNGNLVVTEKGPFTAPIFGVLTPDHKAGPVNKSRPGFVWRIFLSEFPHAAPQLEETELALAGELGDENFADPELSGPATGAGTVFEGGPLLEFEIPTVINLNIIEGDFAGNFEPDEQMPGVPGVNDIADGASAEIITYVEFPEARLYTFGVNSDDGFRMEGGPVDQPDQRVLLGEFPNPRGAGDSTFSFEVEEAGVYCIRTIWWNGAGGANIELFSVKDDGTKVLLNDTGNGGFAAYRGAGGAPFQITEITRDAEGNLHIVWNSDPGATYAIEASPTLGAWQELDDGVESEGTSTEYDVDAGTVGGIQENGQFYIRIRGED
jgi:hypothetical protein